MMIGTAAMTVIAQRIVTGVVWPSVDIASAVAFAALALVFHIPFKCVTIVVIKNLYRDDFFPICVLKCYVFIELFIVKCYKSPIKIGLNKKGNLFAIAAQKELTLSVIGSRISINVVCNCFSPSFGMLPLLAASLIKLDLILRWQTGCQQFQTGSLVPGNLQKRETLSSVSSSKTGENYSVWV